MREGNKDTASPPLFEGFGPVPPVAETKLGVQMLQQRGWDGSAARGHSHVEGVRALRQAALRAGLWRLCFSDNAGLTKNRPLNLLQPGMASPYPERPVSARSGADGKIVWEIAISTAMVYINFLKQLGEINIF